MKITILLIVSILFYLLPFAQDNGTLRVNTLNQPDKNILSGYLNPTFINGRVFFKDGTVVDSKLNFNRLTKQMYFISPKNDTMIFAHPEKIYSVTIGVDTFLLYKDIVLRKLTHNGIAPDLYVQQEIKFIGTEKKGAYGSYSEIASANSNSTYTSDDQITRYINIDENALYKVSNYFYVSDSLNNFYPVKKKLFNKIFPQYEKESSAFIDANKINLNKKEDLIKLINYLNGLK
jgi:hypothetical protein